MNILRAKVALIGDQRVGKTCIVSQLIKQYFNNTYQTTLGIDYNQHEIKIKDTNYSVQLHILDCTGFSAFTDLITSQLSDVNFIIYVYDTTNLGIGDWGLGIGPNPQSPMIANQQKINSNYINFKD
jgi:small GTP-binding protein